MSFHPCWQALPILCWSWKAKTMDMFVRPKFITEDAMDCQALSLEERGALDMLRDHYWRHGMLPMEDERLAKILGIHVDHWLKLKPVLAKFYGEEWRDEKMDERRAKAIETGIKNSERAKNAAEAKKAKNAQKMDSNFSKSDDTLKDNSEDSLEHNSKEAILNLNLNRRVEEAQDMVPTPTRTHARAGTRRDIPKFKDTLEAGQFLSSNGIAPMDFGNLVDLAMSGKLTMDDIEKTAATPNLYAAQSNGQAYRPRQIDPDDF